MQLNHHRNELQFCQPILKVVQSKKLLTNSIIHFLVASFVENINVEFNNNNLE